jgi:hypothetical protein
MTHPVGSVKGRSNMSGTVVVNDRESWIPAGWIYDALLSGVARALVRRNPAMSALLEAATTEASVGYLDLRGLDASGMRDLATAIVAERDMVVRAGAAAFHNPSFHPGFVARVGDLISMLERDARICDAT